MNMRINVYPFTCTSSATAVMNSFVDSLHQHEVKIHNTLTLDHCDLAVIWSMQWSNLNRKLIYQHYMGLGIPVVVLDSGVLQGKNLWKVGLYRDGVPNFSNQSVDATRAKDLGLQLKPWRNQGRHIIVCGQNQQAGDWKLGQMEYYLELTVAKLRKHTNRRIIVRPHPKATLRRLNLSGFEDVVVESPDVYEEFNFLDTLDDAWAVVSHNGKPGIHAAISGIPVFCDPTSLVAPVGNFDLAEIENPKMPDRTEWLQQVAFTEWTQTEIEVGIPWDRLQRII